MSLVNFNPGNLVRSGDTWLGQAPQQSGRFVTFTAPEYGIRAMVRVIRAQVARGNDTLRKLITAWAPPSENDTAAYVAAVAAETKLAPDAPLDLDQSLPALVAAIIRHENGSQPYAPELIARGIALEKETIMAAAAAAPTPSTNTAIVGGGVSAVTEAVNWVCNVKLGMGMPPGVMSLVATAILSVWHAFYNRKLAPPLAPPQ